MTTRLLTVLLFLGVFPLEQGFYVPGVAPVEFRSGDPIEVKVSAAVIVLRCFLPAHKRCCLGD